MHHNKRIISCILALTMLTLLLPAPTHAEDLVASGTTNGDSIVKNATFSDIANNANSDNIMKMSVYSI
ncbi:MAG TPA: hypothetical protein VN549_01330, partial [Negativicutes bacterium]|nr:hypothetical protein [Negativicutes bacterium]